MFEVWLCIDSNASWEKLVDALDTMKCHRLARSIKTEYADAKKEQGMLSPFFNSYLYYRLSLSLAVVENMEACVNQFCTVDVHGKG